MSDFFAKSATDAYHLYLSLDSRGTFWLSATDGEGPVLLRDALTLLPHYMLKEYRLNQEETPIRVSRLLVVRDTLLRAIERGDAPGLHLHMGDEVQLALLADSEADYGLTFFLDFERSSLIGRLPEGATYLESGWFGRFSDHGYELIDLPGFEDDDLDWIGRRIGIDEWQELLVKAIPSMRQRLLKVSSEIEYNEKPVGQIEVVNCDVDSVQVRISNPAHLIRLQDLPGYQVEPAWSDEVQNDLPLTALPEAKATVESVSLQSQQTVQFWLRPALDTTEIVRLFGSEQGGKAEGKQLAEFARLLEKDWGAMASGEALPKFRDLHRIYDASDWRWSLRGGPVLERGVGEVRAEPVLSAGGQSFTAAELTDAWSDGRRYLRLQDGWIDLEAPEFARSLREHGAGGGASGMITAGFSYRQRIGLPSDAAAGELPLALEGPQAAKLEGAQPALTHLRYLAGWGMNGGIYGGVKHWLPELAIWVAEKLAEAPDCRLLVVGRREELTELVQATQLDVAPYWLSDKAESKLNEEAGLILVPVSSLQRTDETLRLQGDILLMLEPDLSVRSDETRLFSRLDSAEISVRIAVYSDEGAMNDARVRAVQIRLLKLYDSVTRSYLLLNPETERSAVSARPPLRDVPNFELPSWRKENGMAEMFVETDSPSRHEASPRRGMAIPPRIGAEPNTKDTQTSKPESPRSASKMPSQSRSPIYGGEARPIRPTSQQSAEREFIRYAKENEDRTSQEVPFAPFSSYWPTYAAMKPEQEDWYFYWRTEFRQGEKVETDLSYLFIYIYELINGVGWSDPQEGLTSMIRVWEAYRARFRRLDGYMGDWVREFAMVHTLDLPESNVLEQTAGELKGELLDMELAKRLENSPVDLTWELIARLSDYDLTTSRFYKDTGKKVFQRVLPHVIAAIDEYATETKGVRLTGLFNKEADIRLTERYLFRSAVYDPEAYGRTLLIRAPKWSLHTELRDLMTQVVRLTENELRAHLKFGGRLRGIKLDAGIAEAVAAAVERELVPPEDRVLPQPPKLPEVKFDLEELNKLRRDSDEVLRMLTGELMNNAEEAKLYPAETPEEQKPDIEAQDEESFSRVELELPEAEPIEDEPNEAVPGAIFFDVELDVSADKPYVESKSEDEPEGSLSENDWELAQLDDDWQAFATLLNPIDRQMIQAVLRKQDEAERMKIAGAAGELPETVIDRINEAAMETIGDLLIDAGEVLEEYLPILEQLYPA
ncbi:TerB N-terminal domain-containing protein [Saccharibacillus sp. JS10]|uniref:TerB N-terminal domain-containing protein n=1 Tax=Saccharibacillus sp. JS10 TaxID=2950552 RepID=UPI00210C36A8|nr:TerB N-terminal domain-containing protein [Saccharibacillus sp. JS10]MCQ4087514.1 TerB N-terminal domain-containing protein [Saccharibacillus sp. JS10]